jgi:indole-3-glycerol phosphate synthase
MNILEKIIAGKKVAVKQQKDWYGIKKLEAFEYYERDCESLVKRLKDKYSSGVIAEYKRKSPSKGIINSEAAIEDVVKAYEMNGATGISILTDEEYFGGSNDDMIRARELVDCPLLRKDFIIDEYQLVESKAIGADVILLIAACLTPSQVKYLARFARSLNLEVLLEVHDEDELGHICDDVDIIGVNNRDLKSFEVNLEQSVRLSEKIGNEHIKISESGINDPKDIVYLIKYGFDGFLIGENFMKQKDPGKAFGDFITELNSVLPGF